MDTFHKTVNPELQDQLARVELPIPPSYKKKTIKLNGANNRSFAEMTSSSYRCFMSPSSRYHYSRAPWISSRIARKITRAAIEKIPLLQYAPALLRCVRRALVVWLWASEARLYRRFIGAACGYRGYWRLTRRAMTFEDCCVWVVERIWRKCRVNGRLIDVDDEWCIKL